MRGPPTSSPNQSNPVGISDSYGFGPAPTRDAARIPLVSRQTWKISAGARKCVIPDVIRSTFRGILAILSRKQSNCSKRASSPLCFGTSSKVTQNDQSTIVEQDKAKRWLGDLIIYGVKVLTSDRKDFPREVMQLLEVFRRGVKAITPVQCFRWIQYRDIT